MVGGVLSVHLVLFDLALTICLAGAGVLAALGAGPLVRLAVLGPAARRLGAGRPVWAPRRWRVLVADALPIGAGQVVQNRLSGGLGVAAATLRREKGGSPQLRRRQQGMPRR